MASILSVVVLLPINDKYYHIKPGNDKVRVIVQYLDRNKSQPEVYSFMTIIIIISIQLYCFYDQSHRNNIFRLLI